MKNKPLIITLIIILSILAIGVIGLLVVLLTNGTKFNRFFNINFNFTSKTIIHDEYYENNFELIDIKNSLGDVYFLNSNDERVHVVIYGEEDQLSIRSDNSLTIDYKTKSCFGFCFNQPLSKIEVYVPSSYDKVVKIDNKAGDIKVDDFVSATFKINSDLGDSTIGSIKSLDIVSHAGDIEVDTVERIKAENNLGDIKISRVNEYLDIENNCGDTKIGYIDVKENSRIDSDLGDVEIKHTNDIRIISKVSLGDNRIYNSNKNSNITLDIDNSCGDVKVN